MNTQDYPLYDQWATQYAGDHGIFAMLGLALSILIFTWGLSQNYPRLAAFFVNSLCIIFLVSSGIWIVFRSAPPPLSLILTVAYAISILATAVFYEPQKPH